jgi:predicted ATPase
MSKKKEEAFIRPHLRQFTIENFKAFQKCTLSLPALTILIGENSSGKSSLLQALLLLKQTLEAPYGGGALVLNSHYVQFHQFREIVFGMPSDEATLGFELEFKDFKLGFEIGSAQEGDWPKLLKFHLDNENLPIDEIYSIPDPQGMAPIFGYEDGIIPESFFYNYNDYYKVLRNFFENIGYIQPIRPAPERYYDLRGIKPRWIGIRAENIADFLETNPKVEKKVRNWFVESAKLAREVKFEDDRDRGQMEILFTEVSTGLEIDISRLGFGFSQILPIVVAAFSDMNMLIFEAPEIHLNPNLHGALTDLFIEAANSNKQVLVETHSEHIIYRIQRRVAEGVITPEDIAIYYVRRGEEGSVAERLTLTEKGEIPDWPDGFFEAEMEDIYERVLAGTD